SGIVGTIKGIIREIHDVVYKAIDLLIGKIMGGIGKLVGKGKEKGTEEALSPDVQKRWLQGKEAIDTLSERSKSTPLKKADIEKELAQIKTQYGFKELRAEHVGKDWTVHAVMNPSETITVKGDPVEA